MGYVYKVTNLLNNKVYIGITTKTIEENGGKREWAQIKPGTTKKNT